MWLLTVYIHISWPISLIMNYIKLSFCFVVDSQDADKHLRRVKQFCYGPTKDTLPMSDGRFKIRRPK